MPRRRRKKTEQRPIVKSRMTLPILKSRLRRKLPQRRRRRRKAGTRKPPPRMSINAKMSQNFTDFDD